MNRNAKAAAALAAAAALLLGTGVQAQGTVGSLRIVDETGQTIGQEAAPPGEKLFRLPAGVTAFRVAMDFEGSAATDVQLRVMGPSGTILFQSTDSYSAPETVAVDVDNNGQPFTDQEYVINAYVGADAYLADSLQLVVGDAQLPTPAEQLGAQSGVLDPLAASGQLVAQAPPPASGQLRTEVPGGPSNTVLALAVAGIAALFAIVLWAGWSATRRA